MRSRVDAFWCRVPSRPNFGDALTPWLIRKLTGSLPRFIAAEDARPKFFVTGSVIAFAGAGSTVWGAGIMTRHDPIARGAMLLAVRGPLTRARALERGVECPPVYGDPALLLPRLHAAGAGTRARVGIVPHFSDAPIVSAFWRDSDELRRIDIQAPIERVIDDIASCELVASSSLHGLIVAHAYGVPAVWVKFRDLPSGDDSKFHDYYLSFGCEPPAPLRIAYERIDADAFRRHAIPAPDFDCEPLWNACPFRENA